MYSTFNDPQIKGDNRPFFSCHRTSLCLNPWSRQLVLPSWWYLWVKRCAQKVQGDFSIPYMCLQVFTYQSFNMSQILTMHHLATRASNKDHHPRLPDAKVHCQSHVKVAEEWDLVEMEMKISKLKGKISVSKVVLLEECMQAVYTSDMKNVANPGTSTTKMVTKKIPAISTSSTMISKVTNVSSKGEQFLLSPCLFLLIWWTWTSKMARFLILAKNLRISQSTHRKRFDLLSDLKSWSDIARPNNPQSWTWRGRL